MSYDIFIAVSNNEFSEEKFFNFLNECKKLKGDWELTENFIINEGLNKIYDVNDENLYKLYQCNLFGFKNNDENDEMVCVWIDLNTSYDLDETIDKNKYSRYIHIETGASRSFLSLAIQFLIPIKAFEIFTDAIVINSTFDKKINSCEAYKKFVKDTLLHTFSNGDAIYYLYFFPKF